MKAINLPVRPLKIMLLDDAAMLLEKKKYLPRRPAGSEKAVKVERQMNSDGSYVSYMPGDMISSPSGKTHFVVVAAGEGWTRSGDTWKRGEQNLIVRDACADDHDAVSLQKHAQDAAATKAIAGLYS